MKIIILVFGLIGAGCAFSVETAPSNGTSNATAATSDGLFRTVRIMGKPLIDPHDGNGCGAKYGCHKGYCWSSCSGAGVSGEWCYTSKGRSQDRGYVHCSLDSECDKCWSCAGPCSL